MAHDRPVLAKVLVMQGYIAENVVEDIQQSNAKECLVVEISVNSRDILPKFVHNEVLSDLRVQDHLDQWLRLVEHHLLFTLSSHHLHSHSQGQEEARMLANLQDSRPENFP